uniref:Uncharacterized protein n=1 Tax=Lepeophtheirus salmonis TaxID=72036 RepID=A0A0K2UTQ8_LEPSM
MYTSESCLEWIHNSFLDLDSLSKKKKKKKVASHCINLSHKMSLN